MDFLSSLVSPQDALRPSYFELAALERLPRLLWRALDHMLAAGALRHPRVLYRAAQRSDELYAVLAAVVEWHYLDRWQASFAENFYGLKRTSTAKTVAVGALGDAETVRPKTTLAGKHASGLAPRQRWGSLFVLVVQPYLARKLEAAVRELEAAELQQTLVGRPDDSGRPTLRRWALRIVASASRALELARLGYTLAYLCGWTRYFTPSQHLLQITVERMTAKDYNQSLFSGGLGRKSDASAKSRGLLAPFTLVLEGLKAALPLVIFGFKFLEWFYQSDLHRTLRVDRAVLQQRVPPPEPPQLDKAAELPPPDCCPLCRRPRTNPALLISSGFVFCYPCIFDHLGEHSTCPVTGCSVLEPPALALLRLYSEALKQ